MFEGITAKELEISLTQTAKKIILEVMNTNPYRELKLSARDISHACRLSIDRVSKAIEELLKEEKLGKEKVVDEQRSCEAVYWIKESAV